MGSEGLQHVIVRFAVTGWGAQTWGKRVRTCDLGEGKEKGMGT